MSDKGNGTAPAAPAPTKAAPAEAAPIHDEASAVAALEGLLAQETAPPPRRRQEPPKRVRLQQTEQAAPEDGDADEIPADDEPPVDLEGDGVEPEDAEDGDSPAIDPPPSWPQDRRELFAQLPPDLQSFISQRETERDNHLTQRSRELVEHRKAVEAERQTSATERDTYQRSLAQLIRLAVPEAQQYGQLDWQRLAAEQPAEYVRLSAQRDALRNRVETLQGEMQRVEHQRQQEEYRIRTERLAEQQRLLVEKVPEFGDPTKAPKLQGEMRSYLQSEGYSPEEIASLADARAANIARKAMLYDREQVARREAQAKRSPLPAPAVQRAGTPAPRANNAQKLRDQKMARLRATGSTRDAAEILKDIL